MKRILLVLTVAVVVASMLVMGASAAAFAKDKIDKPDKKIEKEDKGKDKGKDK